MTLTAKDPNYAERVRDSFARQSFLRLLDARIVALEPGRCTIEMPTREDLCQQHGFVHAGVTSTLADTASGYAAYSLMPADSSVLTVEFKVNLLAPAQGERLVATAEVEKAGQTLVVVRARVEGVGPQGSKPVATMLATMMCLRGRSDGRPT